MESLAIAALLIYRVRVSALVGVAMLAVIVPLQYWFAAKLAHYRGKGMNVTNTRVRVMNEVLLAIKMVKFYAWEKRFANEVASLRAKELRTLRKAAGIKTFNLIVVFVIPPLMALGIYATYIKIVGPLTASVAFVVVSLFNTLRFPLVVLPRALRGTAESITAIKRIQRFLLQPEYAVLKRKKRPGVNFTNATFGFDEINDEQVDTNLSSSSLSKGFEMKRLNDKKSKKHKVVVDATQPRTAPRAVVTGLNLVLPKGKLLGIAGPVGSGKSTIISSILGETQLYSGTLEVGGRMAYVPQTPWVQCATIRENVRVRERKDLF